MAEGNTLVNAVVGAVVGMVSGVLLGPLAPILGGWVAGYLEGGERSDGFRVGAYVGGIMLAVGVLVVLGLLTILAGGVPDLSWAGVPGRITIVALVGTVLGVVGTVGFGALGGFIGNLVKAETDSGN